MPYSAQILIEGDCTADGQSPLIHVNPQEKCTEDHPSSKHAAWRIHTATHLLTNWFSSLIYTCLIICMSIIILHGNSVINKRCSSRQFSLWVRIILGKQEKKVFLICFVLRFFEVVKSSRCHTQPPFFLINRISTLLRRRSFKTTFPSLLCK